MMDVKKRNKYLSFHAIPFDLELHERRHAARLNPVLAQLWLELAAPGAAYVTARLLEAKHAHVDHVDNRST